MENQPTVLDKIVKISIMAGVLIFTLSVAYYLVIFLPKKETTRIEMQEQEKQDIEEKKVANELQSKIEKCVIDAKKFHEAYIKSINGFYEDPEYHYNQKLGRCLYSGGYSKRNDTASSAEVKSSKYYWERIVKDVYTNETVLSTYNFQDADTILAYWEEHKRMMNN